MVYHRGLRLRALLYGEEFQKGIAKATNAIRISLVALEESSFVSNKEFYQLGWYTLHQKKIHMIHFKVHLKINFKMFFHQFVWISIYKICTLCSVLLWICIIFYLIISIREFEKFYVMLLQIPLNDSYFSCIKIVFFAY